MCDSYLCQDCGNYRDTPGHELGCLPFHNTKSINCVVRSIYDTYVEDEFCATCES